MVEIIYPSANTVWALGGRGRLCPAESIFEALWLTQRSGEELERKLKGRQEKLSWVCTKNYSKQTESLSLNPSSGSLAGMNGNTEQAPIPKGQYSL